MSGDVSTKPKYDKSYGAVLFLDALGTKGIWKGSDPDNILRNWDGLFRAVKVGTDLMTSDESPLRIQHHIFSDTVIITAVNDKIDSCMRAVERIAGGLVHVGLIKGIYFRGCISVGDVFQSEKIVVGPAVDEAAIHYQESNWIGIHTTPSAHSILQRLGVDNELDGFIPYDVPMKTNRTKKTWAVFVLNKIPEKARSLTKFNTLIELIHYRLEHPIDTDGVDKWENTLEFLNKITKLKKDN